MHQSYKLSIGDAVESIESGAFSGCSSLTSIIIPDAVTSIGSAAFRNCSSLTSVSIGDGVVSIGTNAFYGCSSLTSITIPDAVETIGDFAFYPCTSLTSLTIPVTTSYTTRNASSGSSFNYAILTDLTITGKGDLVNYAFYNATALKNVTLSDSITSIGNYAFGFCTSLTSITLPDAVETIGKNAFYYCTSLTSITIPDAVTSIGNYAFYKCTSLTSVSIGNAVKSIGDYAFDECKRVAAVYSYNPTPPSCASSSCFSTTAYSLATLHVPSESLSDYASATAWENFINIASDLDTAVESVSADAEEAQPTGYYSLSGQRLDAPAEHEVTIIRYSDGTAKKVFMK